MEKISYTATPYGPTTIGSLKTGKLICFLSLHFINNNRNSSEKNIYATVLPNVTNYLFNSIKQIPRVINDIPKKLIFRITRGKNNYVPIFAEERDLDVLLV